MAHSLSLTSLSFSSSSLFSKTPHNNFLTKKTTQLKTQNRHTTISLTIVKSQQQQEEEATLPILSFEGQQIGTTTLSLKTAPPDTARAVVHRAIITDRQNARRGTASTLTRAEVRGGGIKPYPQKKTGRARRGSNRSPLRPGGGVIFGPKPRDWGIKINRKEKRLAISTALMSASVGDSAFVVEDFGGKFERPKTKEFIEVIKRWGLDPYRKSMFFMMEVEDNLRLSSRNIGTLRMLTPRTLNLFDILNADKIVFTPRAVEYLNDRYGVDSFDYGEDDDEDGEGEVEEDGQGGVSVAAE